MKKIEWGRRRLVVFITAVAVLALIVSAAVIGAVHPRGNGAASSAGTTGLVSQPAAGTADREAAGTSGYKAVPTPAPSAATSTQRICISFRF